MPKGSVDGRVVDVRPDRIDFRDFEYKAPLESLPDVYPQPAMIQQFALLYAEEHNMVLDQGKEGACTGFGLAAVVNYLKWERDLEADIALGNNPYSFKPPEKTSERMFYQNARLYDEWPGEDYEGSSCRGAMKGFHKHGVCTKDTWPYYEGRFEPPGAGWQEEASETVLGAYYRINHKSLIDMQAAIHEIHAIYCSANTHSGWTLKDIPTLEESVIGEPKVAGGGHAFAIVGYTREGFIVQNSWGPGWGYKGFAVLPYHDWFENGYDAWALALGAPVGAKSPIGRTKHSLQEAAQQPAGWWFFGGKKTQPDLPNGIDAWNSDDVNQHAILSTIDGAPTRHLQSVETAEDSVRAVVANALAEADREGANDLAFYIHGGLNGEDDALNRAAFMGPWFQANKVVPIFPVWQTDAGTSILHGLANLIGLDDFLGDIVAMSEHKRPDGRALDRRVEEVARRSPAKLAWTEMKDKARGLSETTGALDIALDALEKNKPEGLKIHLAGHSAGALVIGHMLRAMQEKGLKTESITLYAPACSARFTVEYYGAAFEAGVLPPGGLHIHYLSDQVEQSDACVEKLGVTLYSKSLLYLVSRAFETRHKMPLLGLEHALTTDREELLELDVFSSGTSGVDLIAQVEACKELLAKIGGDRIRSADKQVVTYRGRSGNPEKTMDNQHGAFDNDVEAVTGTIRRIRGGALDHKVGDLDFG